MSLAWSACVLCIIFSVASKKGMSLQDLTQVKAPAGDEADEDAQQATSFFQWFDVPEDEPATEDEIAEIIRDQIWPNPLQLYMGETVCTPG